MDSDVLRVLYTGALDQLLELFDKGLVSPFSINAYYGFSLLHVSEVEEYRCEQATGKLTAIE